MKEIKGDTSKCKDNLCSWIGRLNIVKMPILPKAIYRFKAILIKLQMAHFYRNRENNSKIYTEPQKPTIVKTTLRKKKVGDIPHPDFKIYY